MTYERDAPRALQEPLLRHERDDLAREILAELREGGGARVLLVARGEQVARARLVGVQQRQLVLDAAQVESVPWVRDRGRGRVRVRVRVRVRGRVRVRVRFRVTVRIRVRARLRLRVRVRARVRVRVRP